MATKDIGEQVIDELIKKLTPEEKQAVYRDAPNLRPFLKDHIQVVVVR